MQFNVVFIATALLSSASLAMSAEITFFTGAGCSGSVIGSTPAGAGVCAFLTNGGSGKSIGYSGVPNSIGFYLSGGPHDFCSNDSFETFGGGSGCGTAPDG
jgi:hypothetical protein